jgi:hypothetical protein
VPEPELSDPKAREEPGEPSQAGGAGLGLDPGTEIEVTTVDSYNEAPRTYTTTLELLEERLARDIEEYFKAEVKSNLRETLFCVATREVYSVHLDKNVLVAILEKGEYTVKKYVPLKSFEYIEREIDYVNGSDTFKVGRVKGFKFIRPKADSAHDCYYAQYTRFERIAKDIIGDLTGDTR